MPDQRTAIGMVAAGCTYPEVGEIRGWTQTKVNRCLCEGRKALAAGFARSGEGSPPSREAL